MLIDAEALMMLYACRFDAASFDIIFFIFSMRFLADYIFAADLRHY